MEQQPQKPLEHKTGTLGGLSNRWHGAHGRGRGTVLGAHSRGGHRIKDNGATSPHVGAAEQWQHGQCIERREPTEPHECS